MYKEPQMLLFHTVIPANPSDTSVGSCL